VPQELVPDGEVDPDGPRDFTQKGHKSSGELIASKGAWLVREGAVGNVPRGNALAAYFTFFVRKTLIGQTEAQVHRLKLIKRQAYGRASFEQLRLRVLHGSGVTHQEHLKMEHLSQQKCV